MKGIAISLTLLFAVSALSLGYSQKPQPKFGPEVVLSEQDLVDYAIEELSDDDKARLESRTIILGKFGGILVVADHPCSDICPNYTTRIVHFELPVGPECTKQGGVIVERLVPMGVATGKKEFCVPAPLAKVRFELSE